MAITYTTQPPKLNLSGNPLVFEAETDNQYDDLGAMRPFFRLGVDVYKNGTIYAGVSDITPKLGKVSVDISAYTKAEKRLHFTFPEADDSLVAVHSITDTFKLILSEKYGIPIAKAFSAESQSIQVLNGKLSDTEFAKLNDNKQTWIDTQMQSGRFLTNAPDNKPTDIYSPERLYFLALQKGSYDVHVVENYTEGNEVERIIGTFTAEQFNVAEICCAYYLVKSDLTRKLQSYQVYVTEKDKTTNVSEARTFVVDYTYRKFTRYFLFRNSLGVYDLVRTFGEVNKDLDIKKDSVELTVSAQQTSKDLKNKLYLTSSGTIYTANSGYLTDAKYIAWFREFLESTDVYALKNDAYIVVNVFGSKTKPGYDRTQPVNLAFTYADTNNSDYEAGEEQFAPISIGDFNMDFMNDFFIDDNSAPAPVPVVDNPVFAPTSEQFETTLKISITCATSDAEIYYTTDGTEPNLISERYSAPFTISASKTIKAIAYRDGYTESAVVSKTYSIMETLAAPTISPVSGEYYASDNISAYISHQIEGVDIRYTINGTEPTINSYKYTAPFKLLDGQYWVMAKAFKTGYKPSPTSNSLYDAVKDQFVQYGKDILASSNWGNDSVLVDNMLKFPRMLFGDFLEVYYTSNHYPLKVGAKYRLSGVIMSPQTGSLHVNVHADNNSYVALNFISGTDPYKSFSIDFTAFTNCHDFFIDTVRGDIDVYLKSFKLERVS